MPPPMRSVRLQTPQVLPSTSHRCKCICQKPARSFSSTSRQASQVRDEMFRWLNGPGSAFRHPLPGSTNYLNAYDRNGRLVRAKDRSLRKSDQDEEEEDEELDEDGDIIPEKTKKFQEVRRTGTRDEPPLPKETTEDLIPFPMNRQFRSQNVLSEELKDAIYERVMENGHSVRNVSAALGVEMNRVAAVVRLKAVEKNWEKEVRHFDEDLFIL